MTGQWSKTQLNTSKLSNGNTNTIAVSGFGTGFYLGTPRLATTAQFPFAPTRQPTGLSTCRTSRPPRQY